MKILNRLGPVLLFFLLSCNSVPKATQHSLNRAHYIREQLIERDRSQVMVVAHRGAWRNSMENSLPSIEDAIKMGVDIVEIDLQRTADGHLILMHDASLDRTTTGKGMVSTWTLDSIKTLKLLNNQGAQTSEVVPTLEEALLIGKDKILFNLDKADRYFDQVYDILVSTNTTKQVIMKGSKSSNEVREEFGAYLDDVIYMPIVHLGNKNAKGKIIEFMSDFNPVAFELIYRNDSNPLPKEIADVIDGKSLIWYNTLSKRMVGGHDDDMALENPDKAYGYLIDSLNCRIIQTDRPAYLVDYLRSRGLHH